MLDVLLLGLAACATAVATGIGALPVYAIGSDSPLVRPVLWGIAAGVMVVAAVQGMLIPGLDRAGDAGVLAGLAAGVLFLAVARRYLDQQHLHLGRDDGADARSAVMVFVVLFVHSLPEGLALGAAWASGSADLGVFVFLAIALQNIPEGTAVAIPLRDAGVGAGRAFVLATATSVPQPVGAVIAFLAVTTVDVLLGPSFGFAAGAMLALVAVEIAPVALASPYRSHGLVAAIVAGALTFALGTVLSVV